MPPKKKLDAPSKKTVEKKKEKVIEDKTFGIKNKKGKKQQVFIKQVTNQVKFGGQQSVMKRDQLDYQSKQKKEAEKKEREEMGALFRPVHEPQKVSAGADPKSVLCVFFKQGQCRKGDKCKFSHDLELEGRAEKKSLYVDTRDLEEDTMDTWDEDKLKEVVSQKHGAKSRPKTDIVCKHFLQAIEKGIYGWFWQCPNGGDSCHYRHALPPGFVFKKTKKELAEEEEEAISIEELVEREREALAVSSKVLTKITLETFLAWKKRKLHEKKSKSEAESARRQEAFRAGRTLGLSGREMFEFNPDMVGEDDQDAEDVVYLREVEEEEEEQEEAAIVDMTGVSSTIEAPSLLPPLPPPSTREREGREDEEGGKGAGGGPRDGQPVAAAASGRELGGREEEVTIDEDLFAAEDEMEEEEEDVVVDESLFDVENLGDFDIADVS